MSECLYPTLVADSSLSTPAVDDCSTLHRQITSELDKYLQEATQRSMNKMIITVMGDTCLLICQTLNKKLIS